MALRLLRIATRLPCGKLWLGCMGGEELEYLSSSLPLSTFPSPQAPAGLPLGPPHRPFSPGNLVYPLSQRLPVIPVHHQCRHPQSQLIP